MDQKIIFMFSGQGSQYYQMGCELYNKHPRFRAWMDHCNSIVEPLIGRSIIDIIYKTGNRSDTFDRLLYSNPALLSIQFSTARILIENDIVPDYLLGYSLGEFVAAVVSGAMSLEEGIELIVEMAKIIERSLAPAIMLAIFDKPEVLKIAEDLKDHIWITARNFATNYVVSGADAPMLELMSRLRGKNIVHHRLPVNYGFHTPMLDPIEHEYRNFCNRLCISQPRIPVVSSVTSQPVALHNAEFLWTVARDPIEFSNTIAQLDQKMNALFIDVGPSGSLATFTKYLGVKGRQLDTINPFGNDMSSLHRLYTNMQNMHVLKAEL